MAGSIKPDTSGIAVLITKDEADYCSRDHLYPYATRINTYVGRMQCYKLLCELVCNLFITQLLFSLLLYIQCLSVIGFGKKMFTAAL